MENGKWKGLAFSGDERHLFMADYSTGLFDIDVRTKRVVQAAFVKIQSVYSQQGRADKLADPIVLRVKL